MGVGTRCGTRRGTRCGTPGRAQITLREGVAAAAQAFGRTVTLRDDYGSREGVGVRGTPLSGRGGRRVTSAA